MIEINNADHLLDDDDLLQNDTVEQQQSDFTDPTDDYTDPDESDSGEDDGDGDGEGKDTAEYSAVEEFLRNNGIEDPTKLKFENDEGEIEERSFNDLSKEEQLNILEQLSAPDLTDDEINLLSYMRQNNVSMQDMLNNYAAQAIENYKASIQPEEKTYKIDDFSDEELYVADLKSKYPNLTDEELIAELQAAQSDDSRFAKKMDSLRNEYKQLEEAEIAEAARREQQDYEDLRNNLAQAVGSFNEFALDYDDPKSDSLVIEDADKQQMLSYLLDQDANGKSQLVRDLENPDALAEIALLRVKGAEFLAGTTRYYKNELAKAHKEITKLKGQLDKSSSKSTVVKDTPKQSPVFQKENGVYANYFDKLI